MRRDDTRADQTDLVAKDGRTTSLIVAEVFGKKHFDVLRAINRMECSEEFRERNFAFSKYRPEGQRRSYPFAAISRDGFSMLAMGFTGKAAMAWKERFIAAFNAMEAALRGQSDEAARQAAPRAVADPNALQIKSLQNQYSHWMAIRREADERLSRLERDLHNLGGDTGYIGAYDEVCLAGPWEARSPITVSQRAELRAALTARLYSLGKLVGRHDYQEAYAALNAHMGKHSYHDIPRARFHEALGFIASFVPARGRRLAIKGGN